MQTCGVNMKVSMGTSHKTKIVLPHEQGQQQWQYVLRDYTFYHSDTCTGYIYTSFTIHNS